MTVEPKKFFIKDFIQYCSPCFGCGKLMHMRMGHAAMEGGMPHPQWKWENTLETEVNDRHIKIKVSSSYFSELTLAVEHRTHKMSISDPHTFSDFFRKEVLYLYSKCFACQTEIISAPLKFQMFNMVVEPLTLDYEHLRIVIDNKVYNLHSLYRENRSIGSVLLMDGVRKTTPIFDLPLLPKYKLKNQQQLIEKLDIYNLLS